MNFTLSLLVLVVAIISSIVTFINRIAKFWILLNSTRKDNLKTFDNDRTYERIYEQPWIAFHLAISNEDPIVVVKTLQSVLNIDYQNYEIIVVDNNTADETMWRPVKGFCEKHQGRIRFYHVERLKGYKAGALNFALDKTSHHIELIAIIDADTIISQKFPIDVISYFQDPEIGVVQTPLGFLTNPANDKFRSWIFLIYRYFLTLYMPNADRFHCAPFIGAMGLLRRKALEEVGRWNGNYLTEDMELSFRLLNYGYKSRYIFRSYGSSMPPASLRSFKKQHYRWNFGNVQIIRDYFIQLLINLYADKSIKKDGLLSIMACPGIYVNTYIAPLILIMFILGMSQGLNELNTFSCVAYWLIFITIVSEILGDVIMFFTLGLKENAQTKVIVKNLIAWWGLGVNNAMSTATALIKRTIPFEVTPKGGKEKEYSSSPKRIEILLSLLLAFYALSYFHDLFILSISFTMTSILIGLILLIPTNNY